MVVMTVMSVVMLRRRGCGHKGESKQRRTGKKPGHRPLLSCPQGEGGLGSARKRRNRENYGGGGAGKSWLGGGAVARAVGGGERPQRKVGGDILRTSEHDAGSEPEFAPAFLNPDDN